MTAGAASPNPYLGPLTFTYDQRHLFFGRDREARDLLARVTSERLLLFYAQSGAGKSSLLNTRLIPQLQDEKGFVVLPIARVSGEVPPEVGAVENTFTFNLMSSIAEGNAPGQMAHVSLGDFLARLSRRTVADSTGHERSIWAYDAAATPVPAATTPSQRYALLVDQFEEFVASHPGRWQERAEFFRQLDQAMRADRNLWVVLTLREDAVASLDPYVRLLTDRLRGRFYMERMATAAALDAIRKPAEVAGRPFAPGVAEKLVDDLCQIPVGGRQGITLRGQYVEPVQLQVVCYQLWENIKDRPADLITAADLRDAGNVDTALTEFYEETLRAVLADPSAAVTERQLRTWFDEKLITEHGTRGMVRRSDLATGGIPNAVVDQLQRRFLVRAEARAGNTWIELVHDRLLEPIRQANRTWFARYLAPVTQDAQAWRDADRNPDRLYTGAHLTAAAAQVQAHPEEFGESDLHLVRSFIEAGQEGQRRADARRQRLALGGTAALLLVFAALAGWALQQRDAALHQALAAQRARREAEAASTQAVANAATAAAERSIAQAANTAAAGSLSTQEANLIAQLTGVPTPQPATPRVLVGPLPSVARRETATPNPTAVAQQTQLAQVWATQTAIVRTIAQRPIQPVVGPVVDTPQALLPTATSKPVVCRTAPVGEFAATWRKHKDRLGCPIQTKPIDYGAFADQRFEHGLMVWSAVARTPDGLILTLVDRDGRTWYDKMGTSGQTDGSACAPGLTQPPGRVPPRSGFGAVWCDYQDIRDAIGWGLVEERSVGAAVQVFEKGYILRTGDLDTIYVLFRDDRTYLVEGRLRR